jgi:arylsulfatase A-like enzyme
MNSPDLMPTLLGMAGISIPSGIQGIDFSQMLVTGNPGKNPRTAFINNPVSNFQLRQCGFDDYRGVRNDRFTYIRSIHGPWLLYDNHTDPYQQNNICNRPESKHLQAEAESELQLWLTRLHDEFLPGKVYLERAGLSDYFEVNTPIGHYSSPWGDWKPTM